MWGLLILLGLVGAYFSLAFKRAKRPFVCVVEKNWFGQPTEAKEKGPGIFFIWFPIAPFMFVKSTVPKNRQKEIIRIGQIEGLGTPGKVELEDCSVDVIVQVVYKVDDAVKATYDIDDYADALINKVESLIRQFLGGKKLDEAIKEDTKKEITDKVIEEAKKIVVDWGVVIEDISIIDFNLNEKDEASRRLVLAAKKDKEAAILRAEGEKQVAVLKAEGDKQGAVLKAEAEKRSNILQAEGERIRQKLLGEGEGDHIKQIATTAGVTPQEVMAFIRSPDFFAALGKTTIFSMSEGGGLNLPVNLAAIMKAVSDGLKTGGGTIL